MTDLVKRLWRDAERNSKMISRARGVDMPPAETLEGQAALHLKQLEAENARLKADKAELVEGMKKLVETANDLHEQNVGCSVNHYGDDHIIHGLPGYLIDTRGEINAAAALVAKHGGGE